ncbi:cobaltochelatase subunit CobN [Conexibacter sp. JD483]|uniref:cobaltochelatase subunit CobN n=1 Tax=unclassified Conexibacter TaxID=2627773 RepID=UPI0027221B47|nr:MULTISPECIES: cobaltochelatase subunit CobN [unclassified Conexibacter]MDO8189437.1 cobaltochelatase subunit CobN [Conexibacter sp. CPCC 205706]MDO8202026.1 cobaltochelatase subunit CobN [Conexibacter sp. CPCC 205762]MDR9372590.1 cobaltochelatase subunit CobN [Conexibacter sp. JD483]
MLRFVTTADTEILATAAAVEQLPADFPQVRCANPFGQDATQLVDTIMDGAGVVLVRILGGRRGWQDGLPLLVERCREAGIPLLALGGEAEPDAEMTALSSAPSGAVGQAGEYLRHGDVDNVEQLLRFLADTFLLTGHGFEPPRETADLGVYVPGRGDVTVEEAVARFDSAKPTVGICFYRSHRLTGNTAFVDELVAQIEAAGANALAVWSYTLRRDDAGEVAALSLLDGRVDALVTTMLATGGSNAGDASRTAAAGASEGAGGQWQEWDARALAALDVPVIQAVTATASRAAWEASDTGLSPLDSATQVAIPEFDGRLLGGVISFKERGDAADSPVGVAVPRYVADPERCGHVARLAVRHARLRFLPASERKVALLLTAFPTKHAKVGMAVGLDTPASAVALLERLRAEGMKVEASFEDGDALMHALIGAGGHDPEFLTDEHLAASRLRLPVATYLERYAQLDQAMREGMEAKWGPPPGDRFLDGDDFVIAGLELGDVLIAIQPPRGYGEDPVGIYHDPELPPTHHYLAVYWWIEQQWGADAIVHLGKHGTLEWLPGKTLALSRGCAPDATLTEMPLIYPFVVNDPGEGVQAKRRVHAVIVDHLIPPMMRADSYDELAQLEAMLDEYARLEVLDPSKLPALAARIWTGIEAANLQADLGVEERPDDLEELVEHIDGYLCEVKDIQIKDGLHVLGAVPGGDQLRGLTSALLRLGSGSVLGLRRAVGLAYGLDEEALVAAAGAPFAGAAPVALTERFRGPAVSNGDLVDRLESAQMALLDGLADAGWAADAVEGVVAQVLGVPGEEAVRTLTFACEEVLPRILRTTEELDNVVAALNGRHIPAGPSGAPTRGRIDVLPTGRNFYSVDPRALPSQLSWGVGVKLADALLERHTRDHGSLPRTVGLVAWGTAAMRTQGDDVAEILALLGVRPTWHPESQRVTGIEAIPLTELGRPRIDVTVRISGFFRDAFPHLVTLLDDAVALVAALEEPDAENFVAAHARLDAERLASELGSDAAWRRATTRIFGSKPGTYGAGLLQLLETRDWRDDADLAEVYEAWGGYAYGRGLDGAPAREAMREAFARIDVAVKNVDSREHDILDSDDYYQYHGGMIATVRALTGRAPAAYLGDSSDPSRTVARSLEEETRRVFRARVANPRWIASMIRHGYKGAAELSATVDYLFGYDATAGVAEDWMYEQVAQKYLLDDDVAAFVAQSNPWAGRAIAEKLLEAADRGLWAAPAAETLSAIQERFLALEGELEEAGSA